MTTADSAIPAEASEASEASQRFQDLSQLVAAYNDVTEKLQQSHEALKGEVVRLQQELASTDAQLQRSKRLAALGEMAAGIAHEIRNPLGGIGLYASMLVEDLSAVVRQSPKAAGIDSAGREVEIDLGFAADTAGKIAEAVRSLEAIVRDVLSFSREVSPQCRATAVHRVVDRALESQRLDLDKAGVAVDRHDRDHPLDAMIDPDLLQQALVNLIRNACEAMAAHDTDDRRLIVAATPDGANVQLTIRDTGPGIANEQIDRIFNPFFTTRSSGTGLGLPIVHRIIDAHGGAITVENDASGGAVFELSLPGVSVAGDETSDVSPVSSQQVPATSSGVA